MQILDWYQYQRIFKAAYYCIESENRVSGQPYFQKYLLLVVVDSCLFMCPRRAVYMCACVHVCMYRILPSQLPQAFSKSWGQIHKAWFLCYKVPVNSTKNGALYPQRGPQGWKRWKMKVQVAAGLRQKLLNIFKLVILHKMTPASK